MTRTESTRAHAPRNVNGIRSLANPGSMPDVKKETPPALHAASSGSVYRGGAEGGYTSGTTDVETTLVPASRMRAISATAASARRSPVAVYDTQSAPSPMISAESVVAATPTGARPASSPASRPALSGLWTSTPTSSRSGCCKIPRSASRPTLPVLHCATRYMAEAHSVRAPVCKTAEAPPNGLRRWARARELERNGFEAQLPADQIDLADLAALTGGHAACEVADVARLSVRRREVGHVNAAVVVVDHQLREQVVGFKTLGGTQPLDVRARGHAGHLLRGVRLVHPRHRCALR